MPQYVSADLIWLLKVWEIPGELLVFCACGKAEETGFQSQ